MDRERWAHAQNTIAREFCYETLVSMTVEKLRDMDRAVACWPAVNSQVFDSSKSDLSASDQR